MSLVLSRALIFVLFNTPLCARVSHFQWLTYSHSLGNVSQIATNIVRQGHNKHSNCIIPSYNAPQIFT